MARQKITTFLWYDNQAQEAARFYTSVFRNSKINNITPGSNGSAMVVEFELSGVPYIALNGGPQFKFTEAISLSVDCEDQHEIDEVWEKLGEGGTASCGGWLKDRYGLWWQIVPSTLSRLMADPSRMGRVMQALIQMSKIDIQTLQAAYDGQ